MTTGLQSALETLYGLERRKDKLGLEGTRRLLEALGRPETRFGAVHVAGTNGKGSACALIDRVLRATGTRTGLYTSPHLVDFRERIRVDGAWAPEARLEERLALIGRLPEGQGRTFFEVATALAFDHFAHAGVERAVVEVGLGGRLDCTNVLVPDVTAITHIGLDHTEVLGRTHEAIAREKAGIVKPGVPLVSGVTHRGAGAAIEAAARRLEAPLVRAHERVRVVSARPGPAGIRMRVETPPWGRLDLHVALRGRHQADNAVVALAALSVLASSGVALPASAVREGVAAARWPGRLEPCPGRPRLWWDGAHNAGGIEALARAWREDLHFPPPAAVVLALGHDKDADAILATLRALAPGSPMVLTRSRNVRALEPEVLAARARALGAAASVAPDVATAIPMARAWARGGRVLLTGSLMAVGEAMEACGGAPGDAV